jgi:predicted nucleotidyltransferase
MVALYFRGYQERIVGSRSKVRLLRVLFRFPDSDFTGEDLGRKAGVSKPMTHRALSELVEENLVARRVAGRAYLYRLVSGSYSAKLVAPLFRDSDSPLEGLARLLKKKLEGSSIASATVFGSVVRGEEKPDSDIDIYLVLRRESDRTRVEALVSELNHAVIAMFGNRLSPMVKTVEEAKRAYREQRSLELAVESEGRLLTGRPLREL